MAGCDFNPRWFWTLANYKEIYKLLPLLEKPLYHVCSGVSEIGDVKLDLSCISHNNGYTDKRAWQQGHCDIIGDMNNLPFKSGVAGSVICDPPYRYDFTDSTLISELVRICKPRGKIVFIAPWIPNHKNITVISTDLWNVGKNGAYHKIRTMFYKSNGQITDY